MITATLPMPPRRGRRSAPARCAAATFSSVTTAARMPGRRAAISCAGARDQAVADQDVVGALAEPDLDGRHRARSSRRRPLRSPQAEMPASASITSSAITSLRSSRVGTVTSAVA